MERAYPPPETFDYQGQPTMVESIDSATPDGATPQPSPNIWLLEFQAVLQGAVGGFLFGIPLLYTVEVWAIGAATGPRWLLTVLSITLIGVGLLTQV